MSIRALERASPPKKSPNVSQATYFGAWRHNQEDVLSLPAEHVAVDFNTVPDPGLVHERHNMFA